MHTTTAPPASIHTEKAGCQWTNLATVRSAPNELTRRQSVRERCVSASGRDRSQIQARQCGESPRIPAIALSNQTATALTSRPSTQPRHSATSSQGDSPCESAVSASKQTARTIAPKQPGNCRCPGTVTILIPRRLAPTQRDEYTGRPSVPPPKQTACTVATQQLSDSGCSHIRRSHHPLATSS